MILEAGDEGGTLLDFLNETDGPIDTNYASVTAPVVVQLRVMIDGELNESVWVGPGCSHTWWTPAGGKFFAPPKFPRGLEPGQRLQIWASGKCSLRIDLP